MPELPDLTIYVEALIDRVADRTLRRTQIVGLNLLRTASPGPAEAEGRRVLGVRRLGKRIVLAFEDELFFAIHLMIAGRLQWRPGEARPTGKIGLAAFVFDSGTLLLTEAGTKQRAGLHVLQGESALHALDAGGVEPLEADAAGFAAALVRGNHTLKRALTDPRLFHGIGNAYSDEILHRARLSPFARAAGLDAATVERLHAATTSVLRE